MAARSLGKITTSSTTVGVRFTNLETDATAQYKVQGYSCQALQGNTGVVYVCNTANPNLTTFRGVIGIIPVPSSSDGKSLPVWAQDNPTSSGGFNLAEMYILPAVTNEGALVSATRS